jgi:hypothetical protein
VAVTMTQRLKLNHPSTVWRHWKKLNEDPKPKAEHKLTTLAKTEEVLPISSEALNIAQRNAINSRRMWLNSRRRLIGG